MTYFFLRRSLWMNLGCSRLLRREELSCLPLLWTADSLQRGRIITPANLDGNGLSTENSSVG